MQGLQTRPEPTLSGRSPLPSEDYVVQALPPVLRMRDMLFMFVLLIFFVTNVPNAVAGGAAGITFWLVGGLAFFIPSVMVTAQLGVMFPHEGSLYNWTYQALGPFWSFFATFCYWIPGPLLVLATGDLLVSYLQNLNTPWLAQPWEQGIALVVVIAITGLLSLQRYRMVSNMVALALGALGIVVVLLVLSAIVWLLHGHHSATSFAHASDWLISWSPWWNPFSGNGNFGLFGLITLGYLGVNIPLNMAGEMVERGQLSRRIITRHLLYGVIAVIIGYVAATWAILVVQGQNGAYNLFAIVSTVDTALGKGAGDIVLVCVMLVFLLAATTYNFSYARFLFVGSVDKKIPVFYGKLNRVRIPQNAILIQTGIAIGFTVIFFMVLPYVLQLGKPTDLVTEVYFVAVAASTLIWAFATLILFLDILVFLKTPARIVQAHLFSPGVLALVSIVGLVTGILAIGDTITNTWIPLIPNSSWWYLVGTATAIVIIVGAIASLMASGEASWQFDSAQVKDDTVL